jgi:hypothetical protein
LFPRVPTGYLKVTSDRIELDPDEQVRAVVQLIFDKYDELQSVHAVFRYLLAHDIRLGIRLATGPQRGQLEWRRPHLATLHTILRHPMYAGAYVYGRRHRRRSPEGPREGTMRLAPMAEWTVLRHGAVPAYITWEQYLANQERLRQHRSSAQTPGSVRAGAALLSGLIRCGTGGRRLRTRYRHTAHYLCDRHQQEGIAKVCYGLRARPVDDLVAHQVLQALQPAALELSLQAIADQEAERARLDRHWQQRLQRAHYDVHEAERRYRAVDPDHRLVARSLERAWEEALQAVRQLEEAYERFLREKPPVVSAQDRERIRVLATDIPALWQAPETTAQDRKAIIRLLVERVIVHVQPASEYVDVILHWHGGFTSRHTILRPVRTFRQLRDYKSLLDRLKQLRRAGRTAAQIAEQLNQEGFTPPRRRGKFIKESVRQLLSRYGLSNERHEEGQLGTHEWWLPDLAQTLAVSPGTLRWWARHGWLRARQTPAQGLWIVYADPKEMKRLRKLAARSCRGTNTHPAKLTTPARPGAPPAASRGFGGSNAKKTGSSKE